MFIQTFKRCAARIALTGVVAWLWSAALAQSPATGAERMDVYLPLLADKRVALVVNHSSLVGKAHLADTLLARGVGLKRIFAPEHGFRGAATAGEEVKDGMDVRTGLPIVSLYGDRRKPNEQDFAEIDAIVFDIQDVGARFYTYISTLFYVAEACAEQGKMLMVLDRPNPNGHYVDGPVLDRSKTSFVGIAPLPIVHGCTVGELARLFAGEGWINKGSELRLEVVPCANYTHHTYYELPVKPSPNIPDTRAALLYPSTCLFEGTKVTEGRGTDRPFQVFGYPGFAGGDMQFTPGPNEGVKKPRYNGEMCYGIDLSALPVEYLHRQKSIDLYWLIHCFLFSPRQDDFFNVSFFDKLAGVSALREQIAAGKTEAEIRASWEPALGQFKSTRQKYLIYPE